MKTAEEWLEFRVAVLAVDRSCVAASVDSPCDGYLQVHHVVTQQQLRREGLRDHLTDPSIGAAVCERHHRRHHNRTEPISRSALPERVVAFVAEHNLGYYLDRYYRE